MLTKVTNNGGAVFLQFCLVFKWIVSLCSKSRVPLPHRVVDRQMECLLNELSKHNVGYHIGGVFADGFGYVDDLTILTPSVHAYIINLSIHL